MLCSGVSNEGLCQISKPDSSRNQRNKNSKKLMSMLLLLFLFLFVMSQASYNLVTLTPEYYQIADDAPFTSTEIERERLQLLTELLVSDCRVLMERLVDRR